MSIAPRVADAVLWAAVRDGLRSGDDAVGSTAQWAAVAEYAAGRGADPWPARAEQLAAILGCGSDVDSALTAASDALAAAPGPGTLRSLLLGWLAQDLEVASPLMGAFTSHDTSIEHPVVMVSRDETDALADWLDDGSGQPARIVEAEVIGGGFSRRMWRVTVDQAARRRKVIVRIEQGGMFGTDTLTEVRTMRALHGAGFSVPAVEAVEPSGAVLGEPFFVMEEVPGVVRVDDEGLDDIIRSVAELHRVPISVVDESGRTPEQVVADNIEGWRSMYRLHSPEIPLLEDAAAWLHRHLAPTGPSVIVHGDAGPGNALFDPQRGLTTIDWEFAHVGDAAEDWAYLALIRGRRTMGAEAWTARLDEVAGVRFDDDQWRTWLAFNHYRGACVNLSARTVFENGPRRTADQLAIGVAVHLRFLDQLTGITCA